MITKELESQEVADILSSYRKQKGSLIPILQEVQTKLGYLPRKAMQEIASFLEIPEVDVWGVATFYNQFRFVPLGKHHVKVCMGTACHLAGGKLILEALERELDIKVGETAEDGNFSLERVACIGCCMLAPVIVIGDKIYPKMTSFKAEEALIPYKQEDCSVASPEATINNSCSVASPEVTNKRRDRSHDATRMHKQSNYNPPYKTFGKSRSLRLKDFNYASPGVVYHITIGTNGKQKIFINPAINRQIINILKDSAKLYGYKLVAYCLMPDHLHILLQAGNSPKDLKEFVRGFKSYCSVVSPETTNKHRDRSHDAIAMKRKLWQRSFYEHILRREEDIADVSEYILNNPVRRGLVEERGQYKWCELVSDNNTPSNNCSNIASPEATTNSSCSAASPQVTNKRRDRRITTPYST